MEMVAPSNGLLIKLNFNLSKVVYSCVNSRYPENLPYYSFFFFFASSSKTSSKTERERNPKEERDKTLKSLKLQTETKGNFRI